MECDEHGLEHTEPATVGGRGLKRKRSAAGARDVRLAFTAAVPGVAAARAVPLPAHAPRARAAPLPRTDAPFMSNMDEISYWVYTKRAPCLFSYDSLIKQQSEQAHCSNTKAPSVVSKEEESSPKKMRKLKLLGDSMSIEKQQNVYFKAPQIQKPTANSHKSEEASSDIDYNIKASKTLKKSKNLKSQKNCHTRVAKKIKISTSTPKVMNLRRSLRKAKQSCNNNSHLESSFEMFNAGIVNGKQDLVEEEAGPDRVTDEQNKSKVILPKKQTNEVAPNGQFEDLSDVSGFTANYIRSTKIHSSKRPHKLRNQNSRNITRPSKQTDKMIMCVDKSVNTGFPDTAALNCSTDSSQNALKLVTVKNNEQSTRVNKSTSLLKFMESKLEGSHSLSKINKQESKNNLKISFQSRSSAASRYPRRKHNNTDIPEPNCTTTIANSTPNTTNRRYNMRKGTLDMNRKENSEEKLVSRTRSGKKRGLQLDVEESCAVLQLNSSTEPASSSPAVNVAGPNTRSTKNNASTRCLRSRTLRDKVVHLYKESSSEGSDKKLSDGMHCALEQSTPKCVKKVKKTVDRPGQSLASLRDKSGFAACFSDSDSDSAPLNQRKFFC